MLDWSKEENEVALTICGAAILDKKPRSMSGLEMQMTQEEMVDEKTARNTGNQVASLGRISSPTLKPSHPDSSTSFKLNGPSRGIDQWKRRFDSFGPHISSS